MDRSVVRHLTERSGDSLCLLKRESNVLGRLWPRGVSKEKAAVDLWLKDLAPSTELRKWFDHAPEKWDEFRKRYWSELSEKGDLLTLLKHRTTEGNVTFVFAASDAERNSAVALKEYLEEKL